MGYFEGYKEHTNKGYQSKRRFEVQQREENRKEEYARLKKKLSNGKKLTKRESTIFNTLEKDYGDKAVKDYSQHMIPVREDHKTVRFIRLRNLYLEKWVTRYGRDKLDKCKENYFKTLGHKPDEAVYWDYGI